MDDEHDYEEHVAARPPIKWEAHEYVHVEKNPDWYWALGLIGVAGAIAALLVNNVLFAILILILTCVLAIVAAHKPNVMRFAVTQRGIRIEEKLYPYNSLDSFSIDEVSPNHIPKLIVNPKNFFAPLIIIPIEDVDPDDIHDFLMPLLEEKDHAEPLSHRISEWLGF